MKIKETISQLTTWFSTVVIVNIRDEDNYELRQTLRLSHLKVVLYLSLITVGVFLLSFILVKTILATWFDPIHIRLESDKKAVALTYRLDSLEQEITNRDLYLSSLMQAMKGGEKSQKQKDEEKSDSLQKNGVSDVNNLSEEEISLRKEFEKGAENDLAKLAEERLKQQHFSIPLQGSFTKSANKLGVVYTSSNDKFVKAAFEGKVIFSESINNQSTLIIQHTEGLLSIYKSNFVNLKKAGSKVIKGERIGQFKSHGEHQLSFACWLNGKVVDLDLKE